MPDQSVEKIRSIDDQLLEAIREIAVEHSLSTADVLLRLLSLTSVWVLSQAPPDTTAAEQCAHLQTALGNVFHHYARQFEPGGSIH